MSAHAVSRFGPIAGSAVACRIASRLAGCALLMMPAAGALAQGVALAQANGAVDPSLPAARSARQPATVVATPPIAPPPGASASAGAIRPATPDKVVLYRSVMPDGRIVIGDHPAPGARQVQVIGTAPTGERADTTGARRERDYWRKRAEEFAQRQRAREEEAEREREATQAAAAREQARQARAVAGPPILYRPRGQLNYTGQQPAASYETSPGAAGRNLGSTDAGALGTPGVGAIGTPGTGASAMTGAAAGASSGGFGPGAAAGAPTGFVGSGFAPSSR